MDLVKNKFNISYDIAHEALNVIFERFDKELLIKSIIIKVKPYSIALM